MSETHSSIMARLMPLYEMAPERFMAFYDAVYLMCVDLPEGCRFRISDRCREKDLELCGGQTAFIVPGTASSRNGERDRICQFIMM